MKKNVLKESIELMGISDGDVIRVYGEKDSRDYRYNNGAFEFINAPEDYESIMPEDEIYELITGKQFEILAYGYQPYMDICQAQINDIYKSIVIDKEPTDEDGIEENLNYIQCQVDHLLDKEKAREKDEEENKKISKWLDIGLIVFWGAALIIMLLSVLV